MPPERRLAEALGVNRSTVLNAYRELKALGLVDAHVGRGTAVLRPPAPSPATIGVPWRQPFRERLARARDPLLVDLLALTERDDLISFSIGLLAPELLPMEEMSEYTAALARDVGPPLLLQYAPTEGMPELRGAIAGRLEARWDLERAAEEVLVVSGSQQALKDKVAFVPGETFFPAGGHENTLRLKTSAMPEERIAEGIRRLARVVASMVERDAAAGVGGRAARRA